MPGSRRRGGHAHVRPVRLADEAEFLRLVRASRVLHRPWSYPPATHQAFREHVGDGGDSDARFVVCRNDDGAIVGYFGLGQIFYGKVRNAYLGYYAFEPFAGQGYMREGLELVLRYAFGDLHLHRVQASIQPGNERSIALVRGAGFRKEGLARRYLKIGVAGAITSNGRSPSRIGMSDADRPRSKGPVGIGRPSGGALYAGDYSWPSREGIDWNRSRHKTTRMIRPWQRCATSCRRHICCRTVRCVTCSSPANGTTACGDRSAHSGGRSKAARVGSS